jgi:hypothetical protein
MTPGLSLFFFFVGAFGLVLEIIEPRIGLRPRDDAGDVRIFAGRSRPSLVAALFRFLAPDGLGFLLFSARPFAFAFASS